MNYDPIKTTNEILLDPAGLNEETLAQVLSNIHTHQIDYADLYFQALRAETWVLEQGIVKDTSYDIECGVGVRTVSGEKMGLAYSDDISKESLIKAAKAARSIASAGQSQTVSVMKRIKTPAICSFDNPLSSFSESEKVDLLKEIERIARAEDPRVSQVIVSLSGEYGTVLVMATDGTLAADIRPLVRLHVTAVVEENGRFEDGSCGGGGRDTYAALFSKEALAFYPKEAVREAILRLNSVAAPAGRMPVVLAAGWPGVLLHEAVGHGLEGDFNRKGSSVFANKIGERVASPLCTVIDNGTIPNQRGSLNIDDEGTLTQENVLIENGILKGYMLDKLNARLMKMKPTGNARRTSYCYLPLPRMTNTYLRAGHHAPEEIIQSVDRGLYAVNFSGGQVDITSGQFVFSASEAYLIEKGKVTTPVKGVTLIGSGIEVLNKVSMVGNDLELDRGIGSCGKDGQSIPVGVGQPTLKIDELTVGGTENS